MLELIGSTLQKRTNVLNPFSRYDKFHSGAENKPKIDTGLKLVLKVVQ